MNYSKLIPPSQYCRERSLLKSIDEYKEQYNNSIVSPREFWYKIAQEFHWFSAPTFENTLDYNFDLDKGRIFIKWFKDGKTNICYNALDAKIIQGLGNKVAFILEGNEPENTEILTYNELYIQVNSMAKVLLSNGVKMGDKVILYLPMIKELPIAMLACARIGAIHVVVFAGFSSAALAERIIDVEASFMICVDAFKRGEKIVETKKIVDEALNLCLVKKIPSFKKCLICINMGCENLDLNQDRDIVINDALTEGINAQVECAQMSAEDVLFILYTSGSTGKPKGIVHTTGGYMVYAATTTKYTFDFDEKTTGDLMFCSADIGWITGHSYVVYGILLNGGTSVIFEGIPTYPTPSRYWDIIEKYKVNKFYTSPTALRSLVQYGNEFIDIKDLSSLKILGTVGEPIDQSTWMWFYKVIGKESCSIVDTYWQTETGGHMLTPLPGCTPMKPGSATFPFFGVDAAVETYQVWSDMHGCAVDDGPDEREESKMVEGCLVFKKPWPGMMRTIYNDHDRFETSYFSRFNGCYMTGDSARIESDYFWIIGRIDDMLNISGHLLSTLEIEGIITGHKDVLEAAVVARPHKLKGECLYCFVVAGCGEFERIREELYVKIRSEIGAFAKPDFIQFVKELPKTRSGKVMRRILRKIATGVTEFGDVSTLVNPDCMLEIQQAVM